LEKLVPLEVLQAHRLKEVVEQDIVVQEVVVAAQRSSVVQLILWLRVVVVVVVKTLEVVEVEVVMVEAPLVKLVEETILVEAARNLQEVLLVVVLQILDL
jgi:hypothetical protein